MGAAITGRPSRFLAIFAFAALAQFAILPAPPFRQFVDGFSGQLAGFSAWLIRIFGGTCVRHAATLSIPARGFAMAVRDGCHRVNAHLYPWETLILIDAIMVLGYRARRVARP